MPNTVPRLGMAIAARPASTQPDLTLMGWVLLGPIKNRVGYGLKIIKKIKRVQLESGFYQKPSSKPNSTLNLVTLKLLKTLYIYIYIVIN